MGKIGIQQVRRLRIPVASRQGAEGEAYHPHAMSVFNTYTTIQGDMSKCKVGMSNKRHHYAQPQPRSTNCPHEPAEPAEPQFIHTHTRRVEEMKSVSRVGGFVISARHLKAILAKSACRRSASGRALLSSPQLRSTSCLRKPTEPSKAR